jgi:hypothetical protein
MNIKKIVRESVKESLFYKGRGIPDMAGKIGPLKKKSNYIETGTLSVRTELTKLVIKFIKMNYPNDLDRYRGNFMYKLNKSTQYLGEDDLINYDSIFLKAVNNKDENSIELANQFLRDVENDSFKKPTVKKPTVKKAITNFENLYNRHINIIDRGEPRLKDMKDMLENYKYRINSLKYSINKYSGMGLPTESLKKQYNYFREEIDNLEFKITVLENDINKSKEAIKNLKRLKIF